MDELASLVSSTLLAAGRETIGLRDPAERKKPKLYPRGIVEEIELKRELERAWKTAAAASVEGVSDREEEAVRQKQKVDNLLFNFSHWDRPNIVKECSQRTQRGLSCFWSYVSRKTKQQVDLSAVVDPDTGVLKCDPEEIKLEVEKHLCKSFKGSMEPVTEEASEDLLEGNQRQHVHEHSYNVSMQPTLRKVNSSGELEEDPSGWLDQKYSVKEVKRALKLLKGGKAVGVDAIPNEFLLNAPDELIVLVTSLFNKIQESGNIPRGWNKGIVTLVHKKGLRELLKNYRPLTVIISLSGLYSRVLNGRLTEVVENQGLLGEEQNGFRKERRMADNNFLLDTVLWKARALGNKVHLAFLDITKAYDTVDRNILWQKLARMGIGGKFLRSLQALYTGDCVVSMVNGLQTGQVYLRRGLRQG